MGISRSRYEGGREYLSSQNETRMGSVTFVGICYHRISPVLVDPPRFCTSTPAPTQPMSGDKRPCLKDAKKSGCFVNPKCAKILNSFFERASENESGRCPRFILPWKMERERERDSRLWVLWRISPHHSLKILGTHSEPSSKRRRENAKRRGSHSSSPTAQKKLESARGISAKSE